MRTEAKKKTWTMYLQAEAMKHRHSAVWKTAVLMPVICVLFAASLNWNYFTIDSYNWWYSGMYAGMGALVCGMIGGRDRKMGNRTILPLPCGLGKIWDAKVLYGVLVSGMAMVFFTVVTMVVGVLMELGLNITFTIRLSVPVQAAACLLLWLSFCWQVPVCLLLSQRIGQIPTLAVHYAGCFVMSVIGATEPYYMCLPGAISARMMCVALGVLPNGLPAEPGQMTFSPELLDWRSIPIGIAASVVWFGVFWFLGRKWYKRLLFV